jgi:hypothetical protein
MSLTMVTSWGEEHGLIKEVANSVPDRGFERFAEKDRVKMEKQKKEDGRMVWVKYINYQGSNERLTAPYMKWAGETIKTYHLIPNHEYLLPMGFVDQVNGNPGLANRSEKIVGEKVQAKDGRPQKVHELILIAQPKTAAA